MLVYLLIIIFISLAVGLVFFLLKGDRGPKEPVGALWLAAGFGLLGALAAGLVEKKFIPIGTLQAGAPLSSMMFSYLGVGVIEECCKFLPLAFFIFPKHYFNEHTDGIIYFVIAGLGFGLPENILYTMQYGSKAGIGRLILTPFFHATLTGMVGYYLVKAKIDKKNILTVLPVLILAILLHALYDFGLSSGTTLFTFISVTVTLALSANLLNLFFRAQDLDEEMGIAAVGHNAYCRSCGQINGQHYLYCTRCGKRA